MSVSTRLNYLLKRTFCFSYALAFGGGPDGYALIQRFSKINISLTIEPIAK